MRKVSESGLGHLLDPEDPDLGEPSTDEPEEAAPLYEQGKPWIRSVWQSVINDAYGIPSKPEEWLSRPALSRFTVSSHNLLEHFAELNSGKPYSEQIKPFNFILLAHDATLSPQRKVLIAPYERNPSWWLDLNWRDRRDGSRQRISTTPSAGGMPSVRVKDYQAIAGEYRQHLEAKSTGPDGEPCGPLTAGLLGRLRVTATEIVHIGKEAARLDEVAVGLVDSAEGYAVYEDAWLRAVERLKSMSIKDAMTVTGLRRSAVMELRGGRSRSSRRRRQQIIQALSLHF